jgi:glyoxylase-like metal-dependent hydrolase (beta-lactamase superfamily II)
MGKLTVTDVRIHKADSGFLLDDGQTAILLDSGFGFTGDRMAEKIRAQLGQRKLDYIFLTHSHYDHALGAAYILRHYPEAQVVAGAYAAKISKELMNWTDTYSIEVYNPADALCVLMVVLAIDAEKCSRDRHD